MQWQSLPRSTYAWKKVIKATVEILILMYNININIEILKYFFLAEA